VENGKEKALGKGWTGRVGASRWRSVLGKGAELHALVVFGRGAPRKPQEHPVGNRPSRGKNTAETKIAFRRRKKKAKRLPFVREPG